jgi:hypothetical protein
MAAATERLALRPDGATAKQGVKPPPFQPTEAIVRPAILTLSLVLLAACAQEAPVPVEPTPAPEPAPEPEPEPVVLDHGAAPALGDCVDLTFTEGAEGEYAIPAAEAEAAEGEAAEEGHEGHDHAAHEHGEEKGAGHGTHVKHHFEMPEGKDALVIDVTSDPAWTFEVAAGVGHCPHHGVKHGAVEGAENISVYVPASVLGEDATSFVAGETWYVHLANVSEHEAGTAAAFTMAAKACVATKVEAAAEPVKAVPPVVKPGAPKAIERGPKAIGAKPVMKKAK